MTRSWMMRPIVGWAFASAAMLAAVISPPPAAAQFVQQGSKLVGSNASGSQQGSSVALSSDGNTAAAGGPYENDGAGAVWVFIRSGNTWTQQAMLAASDESGEGQFGWSVSLSADGNTVLIGGMTDNNSVGAAWVFTRSGSTWTQQGSKLVGGGYTGSSQQGISVALSADGNTAIVGGDSDNSNIGGAWVFTRNGNTWSQQGSELVGTGYSEMPKQGFSVALSADGNTALMGGPSDAGAAWVFTRSGNTWTQQAKLVADDSSGASTQGDSVALSADGNTALVGGKGDNSDVGAAWIFTRSGTTWTQQGPKLVGSGYSGTSLQGWSAALSADGNTAIVGGYGDNSYIGAVWLFGRTGGAWSQLGGKLVGSGYNTDGGYDYQGTSVALSGDGNTAVEGGNNDDGYIGAAWVYVRGLPTNSHDFNDDGVSDILWRNTSGNLAMWLMSAGQVSTGGIFATVPSVWSIVGQRDFNGDGSADILWLDSSGDLAVWLMNGISVGSFNSLGNVGTQWTVAGTGDFNDDGTGDILWRNSSTGDVAIWLMSNGALASGVDLGAIPLTWQIVGTGDFNGDGTTDILWRNASTGDLAVWFLHDGQFSSGADLGAIPLAWTVVGTGDFNGDGTSDLLWRDTSGDLAIWLMSNGAFSSGATVATVPAAWSVAQTGDLDGDGKTDIVWLDTSGDVAVWLMNGQSGSSQIGLGNVGTSWTVQGANAD